MKQDDDISSSTPIRRAPKLDNPGRLSNLGKHKLINIVTSGRSVRSQRQCRVCAVQKKRKEIEHILFANFAMFHYIKVAVLNGIISWKNINYFLFQVCQYMDYGIIT